MLYKRVAAAQSTDSLSEDEIVHNHKNHNTVFYGESELQSLSLNVSPAQWSLKRSPAATQAAAHTPSTRSPMSQTPTEILIHILKHLQTPKDLYNSLRVSRAWCECSVELLWHKPNFTTLSSLIKMIKVISSRHQTFTYRNFIRRLNLLPLGPDIADMMFARLAHCERLERLTMVNCVSLSSVTLTSALGRFPNLVAIDLTAVVATADSAIVSLASSAKRLQGINLTGCSRLTDIAISALAENCPLLRRVKLSNAELITDTSVSALAKLCPLLMEIDLNQCKLITDRSVRDLWVYSTHMREMRLSHCALLTDTGFPAPPLVESANSLHASHPFPASNADERPSLVINRTFEHLRMLDLTGCVHITDDAVEGVISRAPKIRNLTLSKCAQLTDRSVDIISTLGRHLHFLHMGHTANITDCSIRLLARSCVKLKYVDFANCVNLTDMAVFELASLPKLRRIGLVRVTNLTDEAIYTLAERHATLERIHLSYCDQISVIAVHFLVQKLHKLTHLSLTGVPAFRSEELQRFCRAPPPDFNPGQRAAFCVYSGRGVSELRAFLSEFFDRIMDGTDDTEDEEYDNYDEEDGSIYNGRGDSPDLEEEEQAAALDQHNQHPPHPTTMPPNPPAQPIDEFTLSGQAMRNLLVAASNEDQPRHSSFPNPSHHGHSNSAPSFFHQQGNPNADIVGATNRLNAQLQAAAANRASSSSSRFGTDPVFTARSSTSTHVDRSSSYPVASGSGNRPVAETSGREPVFSSVASGISMNVQQNNRSNIPTGNTEERHGALTPELNHAENGHGRAQQRHVGLRGVPRPLQLPTQESTENVRPYHIDETIHAPASSGTSNSHTTAASTVFTPFAVDAGVTWPRAESSPLTRDATNDEPFPDDGATSSRDPRGRSVKRSLRNTLNAAEQYASTFLFGRGNEPTSNDSTTPSSGQDEHETPTKRR